MAYHVLRQVAGLHTCPGNLCTVGKSLTRRPVTCPNTEQVGESGRGALTITKISLALEIVDVISELLPESLEFRSMIHMLGMHPL